jgi:hypothetical protein
MAGEDHDGGRSPSINPTKVDHSLDNLARRLAGGTISRREAVRLLGSALVGGVLASVPGVALAQQGGNRACVRFCKEAFPPGPERAECIRQGARGEGPCHAFGCCVCTTPNPLESGSECSPNITSEQQCCAQCASRGFSVCRFVSGPRRFTCESVPGPVGLECRPSPS